MKMFDGVVAYYRHPRYVIVMQKSILFCGCLTFSVLRHSRFPPVRIRDRDRPLGGGKSSSGEEILLLVGGLTLGEAERDDFSQPNVMCYYPKTRRWSTRANWPERRLRGFSVSRFYNDVIVSGMETTAIHS